MGPFEIDDKATAIEIEAIANQLTMNAIRSVESVHHDMLRRVQAELHVRGIETEMRSVLLTYTLTVKRPKDIESNE